MNFKSLRVNTAIAAVLLGLAFVPSDAGAQPQEVVASLTTSSAITTADGVDMDFGTWLLQFRNADAFELTMTTAGVLSANNLAGGPTDSLAQELVSVDQVGTVTVDLPTGVTNLVLDMQRGAITDFTDVGLTLQNITYLTATEAQAALAEATDVPVTVVAGGTPETVTFGGEIAVTATPADATHTASFDVTFSY